MDGLTVVVVAAGSGSRLGYGIPKAVVPVGGRAMLDHALAGIGEAFAGATVLVTVPEKDTQLSKIARAHGATPVTGGATRAQSVARALANLPLNTRQVLVHDAARCLTPASVFLDVVAALDSGAQAVVPVLPVNDTVRGVDPEGRNLGAIDRSGLRVIQTPQGFDAALLVELNRKAGLLVAQEASASVVGDPEGITDDASLVEIYAPDVPVVFVDGQQESLKITRPFDLLVASAVLEARSQEA